MESIENEEMRRANNGIYQGDNETIYKEPTPFLNQLKDPLSMMVFTGDTMCLHQSIVLPDRKEFLEDLVKEFITHLKLNHWQAVPFKNIPGGQGSGRSMGSVHQWIYNGIRRRTKPDPGSKRSNHYIQHNR